MKKAIGILFCWMLVLTACAGQPGNVPDLAGISGSDHLAPVYQLEIRPDASSASAASGVTVTAAGKLPDTCDQVETGAVSRTGNRFTIQLIFKPVPALSCRSIPTSYISEIPLNTTGLPNGVYLVAVNALETTFEIQALPAAVQTSASPARPAPTQEPSPAPTAIPTGTPTASTASPSPSPTAAPTITDTLPPVPSATPTPAQTKTAAPAPTQTPALPTSTPAAPVQRVNNPDPSSGCTNLAAFYGDVTIPDGTFFRQGISFTKTWRIRNLGTCVWDSGYALVWSRGTNLGGPASQPLPVVKPGETVYISIDLAAPNQGGSFWGIYEFQDSQGRRFGIGSGGQDLFWVKISVSWFNPLATAVP